MPSIRLAQNDSTKNDTNTASISLSSDIATTDCTSAGIAMYFTLNSRAEMHRVQNGIILFDNLIRGLLDLTSEIDNTKYEKIRSNRKYTSAKYGASQFWVQAGTEIVAKSYLTKLKKSATIVTKLKNLFSCKKSCFSRKALTILAA